MTIEWVDMSDGNGTVFRATVGALALEVFWYGALGWLAEVGIPDKREKHSLYVVLEKIPRPSSECPSSLADAQAWAIAAAQRAVQPLIDAAVAEAVAEEREACARVAEKRLHRVSEGLGAKYEIMAIADAIRARKDGVR